MKKQGFTLAEMTVVLVVIGFLAVFVLSGLMKSQPDKQKVLFKKAYSTTERVVGELVNDESVYPYDQNRIGFLNNDPACIEGTNPAICYEGNEKFCQLFARKVNIISEDGEADYDNDTNTCTFLTTDGIFYEVQSDFTDTIRTRIIRVDINGTDKGPNIPEFSAADVAGNVNNIVPADENSELWLEQRDNYYIRVDYDGRVSVVSGSREERYLRSHDTRKDRE